MEPITWLGTRKAAAHLGMELRTLYRLIDSGEIPAYQIGLVIHIQQSDLEPFLERAQVGTPSLQ